MKLGVVSYPNSINIGDEIQSLATMDLLPKVDYFLDRESLNNPPTDEQVKLICNGWFMDNPKNWPPADNINPLFISFHVTRQNSSYKLIPNKNLINYYKKFEPIGCRDYGTLRYFQNIGVKAYYSGCLTLTMQNKFSERNDSIVLADPIRSNYTSEYRDHLVKQMVPKKYHDSVIYTFHHNRDRERSVENRFQEAEKLIEIYSKAKIVITSRIHVALPCLALGTPVYFIDAGYHSTLYNLNDRFEGLIDYFNVIGEDFFPYSKKGIMNKAIRVFRLYKNSSIKPLPIDWENPEPNSIDFKPIAKQLKKTVLDFIKD